MFISDATIKKTQTSMSAFFIYVLGVSAAKDLAEDKKQAAVQNRSYLTNKILLKATLYCL
jgi:hypothetical protein